MPSFKKLKKSWTDTTQPKRKHDKFYSSRGWRRLRDQITLRDAYLCQICKRNGVITKIHPGFATSAKFLKTSDLNSKGM